MPEGSGAAFKEFIEAAKQGGDAGLEKVKAYIAANSARISRINYVDAVGQDALMHAVLKGHVEIVNTLVSSPGILINKVNQGGHSALLFAIMKSDLACVNALLASPNIDINIQDNDGNNPLIMAVAYYKKDKTKQILPVVLSKITNEYDLLHENNRYQTASEIVSSVEVADLINARKKELAESRKSTSLKGYLDKNASSEIHKSFFDSSEEKNHSKSKEKTENQNETNSNSSSTINLATKPKS